MKTGVYPKTLYGSISVKIKSYNEGAIVVAPHIYRIKESVANSVIQLNEYNPN